MKRGNKKRQKFPLQAHRTILFQRMNCHNTFVHMRYDPTLHYTFHPFFQLFCLYIRLNTFQGSFPDLPHFANFSNYLIRWYLGAQDPSSSCGSDVVPPKLDLSISTLLICNHLYWCFRLHLFMHIWSGTLSPCHYYFMFMHLRLHLFMHVWSDVHSPCHYHSMFLPPPLACNAIFVHSTDLLLSTSTTYLHPVIISTCSNHCLFHKTRWHFNRVHSNRPSKLSFGLHIDDHTLGCYVFLIDSSEHLVPLADVVSEPVRRLRSREASHSTSARDHSNESNSDDDSVPVRGKWSTR